MDRQGAVAAIAAAAAAALSCAPEGPPALGEAVVVVDTDLSVPLVARLRLDFYAADGRWFESRDLARPDPRDWPVSFSVYSDDEGRDKDVYVRMRAYPEAGVRDYRGERFREWGGPIADGAGDGTPRLVVGGADVTPAKEPQPLLAVDRVVRVRLSPGHRGRARVVLRGACVGTMPAMTFPAVESCVDAEKTRAAVVTEALDDDLSTPSTSAQGSWSRAPCDAPASADGARICVPGGAMLLGSEDIQISFFDLPLPRRLTKLPRMWVDRDEVTVARFRAALAAGFVPPAAPTARPGPLGTDPTTACTWSLAPVGREDFALTCVTWDTARAFCQSLGGDLPTEAQWEYMATAAGRDADRKAAYVWGDDPPSCDRAVYGRTPLAGIAGVCESQGTGPLPVGANAGDATPLGILGLEGGVGEWVLDAYQDYASACWDASPIADARCDAAVALTRSMRGGSWASPQSILRSALRLGQGAKGKTGFAGFRCVYPAAP